MAMVLVVFIAGSTMLFSAVSPPGGVQENNTETYKQLAEAKEALISYAANYASFNADDDGPGRLPCPDTTDSGEPDSTCNYFDAGRLPEFLILPAGGRFEINDYYVEEDFLVGQIGDRQFWYALSPNYRHNNAAGFLNSSVDASLTLDGDQVVAVIIAPGGEVDGQVRPSVDLSGGDFLEGGNEDGSFAYVTSHPSGPPAIGAPPNFNDVVVTITREEIMTPVTAIVAHRIKEVIDFYHPLSFVHPVQLIELHGGVGAYPSFSWWVNSLIRSDAPDWVEEDSWDLVTNYTRVDSDTARVTFDNCDSIFTLTFGGGITRDPAQC